jgi:hypothetical protein
MPWLKTQKLIFFQSHFLRFAPTNPQHVIPLTHKSGRYWYDTWDSLLPAITAVETVFYADGGSRYDWTEGKNAVYEGAWVDYQEGHDFLGTNSAGIYCAGP